MTEFITRACKGESRYEVIIKTDSEGHYKASEKFARSLIDHEKPQTNADRFCAMSDAEQQTFVRRFWEIEDFADWLKQPVYDWYCADGERKDNAAD